MPDLHSSQPSNKDDHVWEQLSLLAFKREVLDH